MKRASRQIIVRRGRPPQVNCEKDGRHDDVTLRRERDGQVIATVCTDCGVMR